MPENEAFDESRTDVPPAKEQGVVIEMESPSEAKADEAPEIGWFQVFRFSTATDRVLLIFGTLGAMAHGCVMPLLVWILGDVIDGFVDLMSNCPSTNATVNANTTLFSNSSSTEIPMAQTADVMLMASEAIRTLSIRFAILGACSFVVSFIQSYFWSIASENQLTTIRKLYFRNLIRQDVAWYDRQDVGSLTTKFVEDISQIQAGIGDKFALFIQNLGSCIGCLVVGLVMGWQLCLVTVSLMPINLIATYLMFKVAFDRSNAESEAYTKAGSIAQEVLQAIRVVTAFGRQREEIDRYTSELASVKSTATKSGFISGLIMGGTYFFLIAMYALGFSYGVYLINNPDKVHGEKKYTIGITLTVVFAVLEGTFAFGQSLGAIQAFGSSRSSAGRIYHIIDSQPTIDPFSDQGRKCQAETFKGRIEFKQVGFSYPTRKEVPILKGISLTIEPGTTVALVGSSGCGKSTIIQLIQRLYDAESGQVLIDGSDIKDYNISSLRSMFGTVSQEPVLFNTTIGENIRYGQPEVSRQDIEKAAKLANAHNFIIKLPKGYDTLVGEQGAQLSGGQKQRIAIARALVRNPKVLLLDEATSALDTESEAIVQDALDKAQQGRTTIAIAHRLSTIMHADKIIVLQQGNVVEVGKHAELIAQGGVYAGLVAAQQGSASTSAALQAGKAAAEHRAALVDKNAEANLNRKSGDETVIESTPQHHELTSEEKKQLEKELVRSNFSYIRLWKMAKPEIPYYIIGALGGVICGVVWPSYSLILPRILAAYSECDPDVRFERGLFFSLIMLVIGGGAFIGFTVMFGMFALAGERTVLRIRSLAFTAMLKQEISWYDREENSPGALTTRLSTQATALKDATGGQVGQQVQIIAGVIAALAIAFAHDWRITLIMLCFAPLGIISSIALGMMFSDGAVQDKFIEQSSKILVQSTTNIRTVMTLGLQPLFIQQFDAPILIRYKRQTLKALVMAVCFASLESSILFAYSAGFYASETFIQWGVTTFENIFTATLAILFSSYFIGMANSMAPDQAKAKVGVAEIFRMLDQTPSINWDETDSKPLKKPQQFHGKAALQHVEFTYPTRPSAKILQGLTLDVESNKTLALVGASGCGKSTVIQLLERFYDPTSGKVLIDGETLQDLSLQWSRGKMALVSQEPSLFDRTIAENIAYGAEGSPTMEVPQNLIEKAAKMANIHDFISGLPDGYKTRVGERGGQLSGGQKQRVAIARALIRQPKLLLLDEATSALDSESEKVVQAALDEARSGRTVVVIAHRLSTIENADTIAVIQQGQVKEIGRHDELLAQQGLYYNLWSAQSLHAH